MISHLFNRCSKCYTSRKSGTGIWKGLSDKILCIHVRLFKSIVLFYFVNCVIISYQFLFTSSFIQNMSFLGFQKA